MNFYNTHVEYFKMSLGPKAQILDDESKWKRHPLYIKSVEKVVQDPYIRSKSNKT